MKKLQACKLIEKRFQHWAFLLRVRKFLRTPVLKSISERLLLFVLLVQQFICFTCLFTIVKKAMIFRCSKCLLKLDYAIE